MGLPDGSGSIYLPFTLTGFGQCISMIIDIRGDSEGGEEVRRVAGGVDVEWT